MALWIKDWAAGVPAEDLVHEARYGAALEMVRAGYEDMIALRDRLSPGTHLVLHAYDFAVPDGRGICFLGPWLKPTFDLRGFAAIEDAQAVVRVMLNRFAEMLSGLATRDGVTFINAQGTLVPERNSWHNELHPSAEGFNRFADIFRDKLRALFLGRLA